MDWKDLQRQVARVLTECGMQAEVERRTVTARGHAEIDVHAIDHATQPPSLYLCECKHWGTAVSQGDVRTFRSVVEDAGANFGLFISSAGFQSGAFETSVNTNVKLLRWDEFQQLFVTRWIERFMRPKLRDIGDPLFEYTDPIGSRVHRFEGKLSKEKQRRFVELCARHSPLGLLALHILGMPIARTDWFMPLPFRQHADKLRDVLPGTILDALHLREFYEQIVRHVELALADFDELFGKRIV